MAHFTLPSVEEMETRYNKLEVIRTGPNTRKFFLNGQELDYVVADTLKVDRILPGYAHVTLTFAASQVAIEDDDD